MTAFRVIQGCPCGEMIAPYFAICVQEANAHVNSIYRGSDAAGILHAHGHHTQAEVFASSPPGVAAPPGHSTHELRSDGHTYPNVPNGDLVPWWGQGIDVNDGDGDNMIGVAKSHGWELFRPFAAGVEFHHLNFRHQPVGKDQAMHDRLVQVRHSLPTT